MSARRQAKGSPQPLRRGEQVQIIDCPYSDVVPGAGGTVVKPMLCGYAVEIRGEFSDAFHKRQVERRVMYFKKTECRPDESLSVSASDH